MKKIYFFLILINVSLVYSNDFRNISDYSIMREIFFPVEEGGETEKKLVKYIEDFCLNFNIKYNKVAIDNESIITNSCNIELFIPGSNPDISNIILLVPLDSYIDKGRFYDVSINQYIALELAKYFVENPLERNMNIVFFGAAGYINEESWGVKQFIENNSGRFDSSLVTILDLYGDRGNIFASGSNKKRAISKTILRLILNKLSDYEFVKFDFFEILTSRLGLFNPGKLFSDLSSISKASVIFSNHKKFNNNPGPYYGEQNQKDIFMFYKSWFESLSKVNVIKDQDYNYQLIRISDHNFIMSEMAQVVFYVILIVLLIFSRKIIFYFRNTVRYLTLRAVPYYLFLFLIYYLLSLSVFFIGKLYDFMTNHTINYSNLSLFYFFIIFFMPLFAVLALFDKIENFPVPKHNLIYMHGAILFSYINFILFLIINLSLAYIYIIVILLLILSHLTGKNIFVKYILYFFSFLPFVLAVFTISIGHDEIISEVFKNPFYLHFYFCYFSFPFFLLFIRVSIINKIKLGLNVSRFVISIWILVLLFSFFLFYSIALYGTYNLEKTALVTIDCDYDKDKSVLIINPEHSAGDVILSLDNEKKIISPGKDKTKDIDLPKKPYLLEKKITDGKLILNIKSDYNIYNVEIILKCPKNISFSRINHRYSIDDNVDVNNDYYKIWIPRNPGKEINLELELIKGFDYEMQLNMHYRGLISDVIIESKFDYIDYRSIFREKIHVNI